MGSIGCALAFGHVNDIAVTGVGFTIGDLIEDLHSSLLRHPGYPDLFDRSGDRASDVDRIIDDFLATHDAIEALHGRDVDPYLAGPVLDIADRARIVAGTPGLDGRGRRIRASDRRCVVVLVASMATTGNAIVCGAGPRLGLAFANAVASLQGHPLLPAFSEQRPPMISELEALRDWRDPVTADLVLETELD